MSETEHALELLARLNAADRGWIVERLSDAAKARLMGVEPVAPKAEEPPEPVKVTVIERLCGADPDRLCAALRSEPGWLICAVLRANDWPWRTDVLHGLLPPTRSEVARLERQGTTLARPAMDVLLTHLAERVGAPTEAYVPPSRFEQLRTRLRRMRRA